MNEQKKDPILDMLETLRETPERDPARAAEGRAQFLAEARQISEQPVSVSWIQRLKDAFKPTTRPVLQLGTLTIAIITGMLLLAFSASAAAARQARPDHVLYPYKLWLEDQRMALTTNPESRLRLHLLFAEERLEELQSSSARPDDPAYARTTANFDQQISAASTLLTENQLNGGLKDNLERLEQEYRDLFDDDENEFEDELEDRDQDDDRDEDDAFDDESEKYQVETSGSKDQNDDQDDANDQDNSEDQDDPDNVDNQNDSDDDQPDETSEPDNDNNDNPEEPDEPDNND